jgi:hypothetical protein
MNAKSYSHNSPRELIHGKPAMYGCKLWSVCGTSGHCFMYKEGRYGHSNCMAYLQASTWNRCTGPSGLQARCTCHVANTVLAEIRQDDLLSLSASHVRVTPNVRLDGAGLYYIKIKGAKTMRSRMVERKTKIIPNQT